MKKKREKRKRKRKGKGKERERENASQVVWKVMRKEAKAELGGRINREKQGEEKKKKK